MVKLDEKECLEPKMSDFEWICEVFNFSIAIENLLSLIWDTSHWNFFLKFGLKTAYDMS